MEVPAQAPVHLSATRDPARADELGYAEAHVTMEPGALANAVAVFRERVAALGGDSGRIDSIATKHEIVTETWTYECGTTETTTETRMVLRVNADGVFVPDTETVTVSNYVPRTCTQTRDVEAVTLTVVGRAFRTRQEER